jgi:hypothetical protein
VVYDEIPYCFWDFFYFLFTIIFVTICNIMNNKFMIVIMNRICKWVKMKVDTLNVSDLVLMIVPTTVNKNIKKFA